MVMILYSSLHTSRHIHLTITQSSSSCSNPSSCIDLTTDVLLPHRKIGWRKTGAEDRVSHVRQDYFARKLPKVVEYVSKIFRTSQIWKIFPGHVYNNPAQAHISRGRRQISLPHRARKTFGVPGALEESFQFLRCDGLEFGYVQHVGKSVNADMLQGTAVVFEEKVE